MTPPCSIEGCESPSKTRGWCNKHYLRWWHHGDPLADKTHRPVQLQWLLSITDSTQTDDCIDWPFSRNQGGYGCVSFGRRVMGAHRLVCQLVNGPAPTPTHDAAHYCGRSICVNPRHIRWATRLENEADKRTHHRNERFGGRKLLAEDVREIRNLVASGARHAEVAERFGVSRPVVGYVINGVTYGWVD